MYQRAALINGDDEIDVFLGAITSDFRGDGINQCTCRGIVGQELIHDSRRIETAMEG
jgi:hypothetical protein